jgi:hypothetical protein
VAAQEFRVQGESRRDQLIAVGSSLFFLAVMAAVLWTRPQFRTPFGCVIAAAASLFFLWTLVREMQALSGHKSWPLVIDEQGVHYASPGQITWAEIAGLETVRSRQRLDLRDAEGRVRVSLPYDLEDAHEVVQFVADMLADRWPEVPLPHEFGRDLPTPMLAAGAALIAALGGAIYWTHGWMHGRPLIPLLRAVAMALGVAAFAAWRFRSVRRLTVGQQGLIVAKGRTPRVLNYADIQDVGLFVVSGKAERHLDVKVTFRDESAAYVLPWRCDPFDVYATVKAAWELSRAAANMTSAAAR